MGKPVSPWFMVVLTLLGAASVFGASDKSNTAAARPNILFAIADDMGHASAYGTRWVKTPSFDRLASRGVLFLNAYTPDAKCSPSRACILTGRNPWQLEAAGNHWPYYPAKFKSWMEALADGGYCVGFTGKGWGPGTLPPERKEITGKAYQRRRLEKPTTRMSNVDYFANFKDFLADCPKDKPFCFWYGGHEPHRPYEYGSGVAKGHYKVETAGPVPPYWPDTEAVRNDLLDYAFEIAHFDQQLGRMIDLLEERGLLDNTLIVATSDNGPPFPRMKGHPFEAACHLPLAMMWPKGIAAPGRKTDALVSFIDFAPTFLEVAGMDGAKAGMQPITGTSLTDLFANRKPAADRSDAADGPRAERHALPAGHGVRAGLPGAGVAGGGFCVAAQLRSQPLAVRQPGAGLEGHRRRAHQDGGGGGRGEQRLLAVLFRQAPGLRALRSEGRSRLRQKPGRVPGARAAARGHAREALRAPAPAGRSSHGRQRRRV